GAHEGHAGKSQRGGGGDHGDDVGIVLEVMRQDGDDDLRVAAIAGGEKRPDGTVDEARDEGFLLARAPLALEKAAGNLAGGEGLFLVVDGEREEVDARLLVPGGNDGGEHGGLAIGGEHGAIRLAGDLAGLENERAAGPVDFDTLNVE